MKVKVVKNKVAPPFSEAEFEIVFGEGINHTMEVLELGEKLGVVERSGTWLSFQGEQLGQGRDQSDRRLKAEPALLEALTRAVRAAAETRRSAGRTAAGEDSAAA